MNTAHSIVGPSSREPENQALPLGLPTSHQEATGPCSRLPGPHPQAHRVSSPKVSLHVL